MTDNYSIWINPAAGHMYNKLQQEIATQAKEFEAPLFEPHVTLLPDIQGDKEQIIATMQQLAQDVKVSSTV
jgi:2'-5' RNA ligase